jgi:hypothetical protein
MATIYCKIPVVLKDRLTRLDLPRSGVVEKALVGVFDAVFFF